MPAAAEQHQCDCGWQRQRSGATPAGAARVFRHPLRVAQFVYDSNDVLRVYYGSKCQLWQPDNAANCSWDAIKQAFVGGGCVASDGPTQCMCRHVRAPLARARCSMHAPAH